MLEEYIGLIASLLTLGMYIGTIDQIKDVIHNKTSYGVSPTLYFMMILNCLSWTIYGIIILNYYILIPNMVGATLATSTLIVIFKYHLNPPFKNFS